jgi:hypothetical protein
MKYFMFTTKCVLLLSMILCAAVFSIAQEERNTEITGFYQQYGKFSFQLAGTPSPASDVPATTLKGGGFSIAQNLAPWFGLWSQTSFYGTAGQTNGLTVRVINNLEGVRWQTKQHGPVRFYVKGGMGFSNFRMGTIGSDTKLCLAYGGGAQIWFAPWMGVVLDASHTVMGLPNLTDANGRDKWDSGITLTTGLAIRF